MNNECKVMVYQDLSYEEKVKLEEQRIVKIYFNSFDNADVKDLYLYRYELEDFIKRSIRNISKKTVAFLNMQYAIDEDKKVWFSVNYAFVKNDKTISKVHHRFCYFDSKAILYLGSLDDKISETKFRKYDKEFILDYIANLIDIKEVPKVEEPKEVLDEHR